MVFGEASRTPRGSPCRAPGLDRLVGAVQRIELEDVAGPDGVGVAGQGLDPGDGHLARAVGDRRGGARAPDRVVGAGLVQAAGPARGHPGRSVRDRPAPRARVFSRHSQRLRRRGAPPRRSLWTRITSGAQAAWAKSWAVRPMRRSGGGRASLARIGPRQEQVDRRAARPDALLQPGQDQSVGPHHPRLDGPEDAQARMGGPAGAQGLLVDQRSNRSAKPWAEAGGRATPSVISDDSRPARLSPAEPAPRSVGSARASSASTRARAAAAGWPALGSAT